MRNKFKNLAKGYLFTVVWMITALQAETRTVDENSTESATSDEQSEIISWGYYRNLDFYYSNFGVFFNLNDEPIPDIGASSELGVYLDLLTRLSFPQYALLEISVNPMPTLGVYIREQQEGLYNKTSIGNGLNLVESVTAGFEEPYAISVFFNNMVTYGANGDLNNLSRGFMGYLLSVGNYHIQRNRLVKDNWLELEWKIKGDIQQQDESLSWNFRLGGKFHDNAEINNTFYMVIRRIQTAANKPILSWIYNTGYELTYSVDQRSFKAVGYQLFLDKKIPMHSGSTIFSIGVGVVHETNAKYEGDLKRAQNNDNTTFLAIRPSIEF